MKTMWNNFKRWKEGLPLFGCPCFRDNRNLKSKALKSEEEQCLEDAKAMLMEEMKEAVAYFREEGIPDKDVVLIMQRIKEEMKEEK